MDSFGNVTTTGAPPDLVREQITIMKVIYDDDEDAQNPSVVDKTKVKK